MWVIGFVRYVRVNLNIRNILVYGDIRLLFFPLCYQHDGGGEIKGNETVLNLAIKLQWASFFLESSIMINDRMNKKILKLIGALFDKLLHFGNSLYRYCCCPVRQPIKLKWASFFLIWSIMIDDQINKKRRKLIEALFVKLFCNGMSLVASSSDDAFFSSCCCLERPIRTYVRNIHIKLFVVFNISRSWFTWNLTLHLSSVPFWGASYYYYYIHTYLVTFIRWIKITYVLKNNNTIRRIK